MGDLKIMGTYCFSINTDHEVGAVPPARTEGVLLVGLTLTINAQHTSKQGAGICHSSELDPGESRKSPPVFHRVTHLECFLIGNSSEPLDLRPYLSDIS